MRRIAIILTGLLAAACMQDSPTRVPPAEPGAVAGAAGPAAARGYIVVLADGTSTSAATRQFATSWGLAPAFVYSAAIRGFLAQMSDARASQLAADPRVRFVERDQPVSVDITQSPTPSWGLDRIDQRALPGDASYTYNVTGAGVTFYGIDTGIRATHSEFTGRMAPGYTSVLDGGGTDDCHGHGTHTAGTVAGTSYGVAKGVTVVPVRVLACDGTGTTGGVIAGIDWVMANARLPAVANVSIGGPASAALDAAVAASVASGVVFAVSAGNSNADACNQSPAREATAITTGATSSNDDRWVWTPGSGSNFGACVDLFAPGDGIRSAWNSGDNASATATGTSMAAPHVTGAAALYLEAHPAATPAQVFSALLADATTGAVNNAGNGSPNLLLYTGGIGGGPPPPPPPPPPGAPADPVAVTAWTTAVPNPSRVRVHLQFAVPTDADSIEVDTSRSPSTTSWATPGSGQFRGPWEAEWAQWRPPQEGCLVTARAWAGTVTSNDVQIDWCVLEAAGGSW